jgi:hypothetical protein
MLRFTFSLVLMLAGLASIVCAQQQEKKKGVQFSCMLWEGPLPQKVYYQDGEDYREVVPYTSSRSLPHWLEKSKEFRLFTMTQPKANGGNEQEPVYTLVGQSKLIPGISPILFILIPSQGEEGFKIRIMALDDSLEGFPAGSFRFANFSAADLMVKFAGAIKEIPAREMTIIKSRIGKNGGMVPFLIGNQNGENVFETRLFAQASGREIVFIGPPKEAGGLPSVRFLPQLLPQKLPQKLP